MNLITIGLNCYDDEGDNQYYGLIGHHENIPNNVVVEVADEVIDTIRNGTQEEVNEILSFLYNRNGRTN